MTAHRRDRPAAGTRRSSRARHRSALTAVSEGQAVYGAQIARRLRAFFTAGAGVVARPFPELSDREREVLDRIAAGLPNAAIAPAVPPEKTVRNYITAIFATLGVRDRAEAVVRAREAGLGRSGAP